MPTLDSHAETPKDDVLAGITQIFRNGVDY